MKYFAIVILINIVLNSKLCLIACQEVEYYSSNKELSQYKSMHQNLRLQTRIGILERHFNADINYKYINKTRFKKLADPVFYGHPKTREEIWQENFLNKSQNEKQINSLIKLIYNITLTHLHGCSPVILYENQDEQNNLIKKLLQNFPLTFVHGFVEKDYKLVEEKLLYPVQECINFILFISDVKKVAKILGKQPISKVVVIAQSSQWAVQEFLSEPLSRYFVNLLVIGQSFKNDDNSLEAPYILYTHNLYIDGLGASKPQVLCSWSYGKFSRNVNLFPPKMTDGYSGHRFVVAAANQPPFVFRRIKRDLDGGNPKVVWDGIEIRILNFLAEKNNFTIEIMEPNELLHLGPGNAVSKEVATGMADIGIAGLYVTSERLRDADMGFSHTQDCAAFITLTSTALPRYRAILGPFHWTVWLALTLTYLIGIFPLAFSDKHTLRHLLNNMKEVENMFWYVFGTFTNCFTFVGKNSWSKTTKVTTRLLIGWYWVFTIIITSCYTGSIIAFVTLPVYPETVDTIQQLLSGYYRVGTLDRGGWENWFSNSSDPLTQKLLNKIELVPDVRSGILNITKAFFWPYVFLGSKAELEYLVQANFSKSESKRNLLHISNECFVPFGVSVNFPKNSVYTSKLNDDIKRMLQTGLVHKITGEVRWELQRSSSGKLLSVGSGSLTYTSIDEKGLTLEDTQGMFLLLGAGFLFAAIALLSEWMGGFSKGCRKLKNQLEPKLDENNIDRNIQNNVMCDDDENHLDVDNRPLTGVSSGHTGHIPEDNIDDDVIIHYNISEQEWDSRSSILIDREVENIFKTREQIKMFFNETDSSMPEDGESTVSKLAFG